MTTKPPAGNRRALPVLPVPLMGRVNLYVCLPAWVKLSVHGRMRRLPCSRQRIVTGALVAPVVFWNGRVFRVCSVTSLV